MNINTDTMVPISVANQNFSKVARLVDQFGSAVKEAFGLDFMDRWGEIEGERADRRAFQHYREGFRLGVRLVLEAIRPA